MRVRAVRDVARLVMVRAAAEICRPEQAALRDFHDEGVGEGRVFGALEAYGEALRELRVVAGEGVACLGLLGGRGEVVVVAEGWRGFREEFSVGGHDGAGSVGVSGVFG